MAYPCCKTIHRLSFIIGYHPSLHLNVTGEAASTPKSLAYIYITIYKLHACMHPEPVDEIFYLFGHYCRPVCMPCNSLVTGQHIYSTTVLYKCTLFYFSNRVCMADYQSECKNSVHQFAWSVQKMKRGRGETQQLFMYRYHCI